MTVAKSVPKTCQEEVIVVGNCLDTGWKLLEITSND